MIAWPHHMAPSEHGHVRAGIAGMMLSPECVPQLLGGAESSGAPWCVAAQGDVQVFNNWWDRAGTHWLQLSGVLTG